MLSGRRGIARCPVPALSGTAAASSPAAEPSVYSKGTGSRSASSSSSSRRQKLHRLGSTPRTIGKLARSALVPAIGGWSSSTESRQTPPDVELDRGRVRPAGELPVKLGTQVKRDPYRLRADCGPAGRAGVGFGAPRRGRRHLRLAPLQLCGHDGTFPRGTHRSMRSWATPRHTARPVSGIGTPKLWA